MFFPLSAVTPAPEIDLDDPWLVSPGIEGFAMFAILGVVLWILIKSMTKHIRKANFRATEREDELYGPDPRAAARASKAREDSPDTEGSGTAEASD